MLSETDGDLVNSAGKINNRFKTSRSEVSGDFLPFFVLCPGKFFFTSIEFRFLVKLVSARTNKMLLTVG
jgi:hypothetical protein